MKYVSNNTFSSTKGNCLLKRSGSVITAFDDVLISESVWHSFADDTCAVCDAEFDDPNDHKIERAHVIKLLQNKVAFVQDKHIYRKVCLDHTILISVPHFCACLKPACCASWRTYFLFWSCTHGFRLSQRTVVLVKTTDNLYNLTYTLHESCHVTHFSLSNSLTF